MQKQELVHHLERALTAIGFPADGVAITIPSVTGHGDYATNVALGSAKKRGRNPLEVAEEIRDALGDIPGISRIEVAPPGFLNFFLDPAVVATQVLTEDTEKGASFGSVAEGSHGKVIIEHTSVNPNKAMHVGHLRNAVLGDSVARLFRLCGELVEVENYIDDTGVQVADTALALQVLGEDVPEGQPFDEYCWDTYAEINTRFETDPSLKEAKDTILHALEEGDNETARRVQQMVDRILACHLVQMQSFGITYDLLIHERDILHSGLWEEAFAKLKESPSFVYRTEGEHAGCWVLVSGTSDESDKVFVRANGTKVYTAKDTAYHLWKFGLLTDVFRYAQWKVSSDLSVYRTDMAGEHRSDFGNGARVITLVDERQAYAMGMVKEALKTLGYGEQAERYTHLSYGVVSLAPNTATALGVDVTDAKSSYAMAGRKGIGVKVSDVLRLLITKVAEERSVSEIEEGVLSSHHIAVGALRYYLLKNTPSSPIIFDYEQALSLQGNSGVYVQYSYARASGILRQAGETVRTSEKGMALSEGEWELIKELNRCTDVIRETRDTLNLAHLAGYAFSLSQAFHSFYEGNPVLPATEPVRSFRLTLVHRYLQVLHTVCGVLGIPLAQRM